MALKPLALFPSLTVPAGALDQCNLKKTLLLISMVEIACIWHVVDTWNHTRMLLCTVALSYVYNRHNASFVEIQFHEGLKKDRVSLCEIIMHKKLLCGQLFPNCKWDIWKELNRWLKKENNLIGQSDTQTYHHGIQRIIRYKVIDGQ